MDIKTFLKVELKSLRFKELGMEKFVHVNMATLLGLMEFLEKTNKKIKFALFTSIDCWQNSMERN